jgi:hypothetical protein
LDITVSCNGSEDCSPSHLICELLLREKSSTDPEAIYVDWKKCARKEAEPVFPTNDHGFTEENVSEEIRNIATFAVQQLENNEDAKRSIIDIMSVKRQVILYVKVKHEVSMLNLFNHEGIWESRDTSAPFWTMKNGVFWDVTPCGSCKNRCFGGT